MAAPDIKTKLKRAVGIPVPRPFDPFGVYRDSPAAKREAARVDGVSVRVFDEDNPPPVADETIGNGALMAFKADQAVAASRAADQATAAKASARRAEHAAYLSGHGDDR